MGSWMQIVNLVHYKRLKVIKQVYLSLQARSHTSGPRHQSAIKQRAINQIYMKTPHNITL